MKRKYSFWQQLMAVILILNFVFLGIFSVVFRWVKQIVIEQYTAAAIQSVDAVARNVDSVLRDIEVLSDAILTDPELTGGIKSGDEEQIRSNLNGAFISNSFVDGIYVLCNSGYIYVGAEILGGVKEFPKAELLHTGGEILWFPTKEQSILILSGNIKKQYFSMGRKIIDVNSLEELGYLNIQINEWQLQETFQNLMDDSSKVLLCSKAGEIVSGSEPSLSPSLMGELGITATLLDSSLNISEEYKIAGVSYVAISAPCNENKWKLIKVIPKAFLYRPVEMIQNYLSVWGAVILIGMTAMAYRYSRKISRPITILENSMKEVEAGNMQVQVDIRVGNEMDDLGRSFNHMVQRLNTLMNEVISVQKHKNEMELEVLHAQINPHFLYNTLNTIRWMAKIKGEESISTAVLALVKLLRISINLGKNRITMQEEIEYVKNYLTIQRLRFNHLFTITYDIKEEHQSLSIPKLLLQPIVENALIYGIDERENELHIKIYTEEAYEQVRIIVEDNGPGIRKEILETLLKVEKGMNKFSKVGLHNINQRIKMYYGEEYGLEILTQAGSGTKIIILIPLYDEKGDSNV